MVHRSFHRSFMQMSKVVGDVYQSMKSAEQVKANLIWHQWIHCRRNRDPNRTSDEDKTLAKYVSYATP